MLVAPHQLCLQALHALQSARVPRKVYACVHDGCGRALCSGYKLLSVSDVQLIVIKIRHRKVMVCATHSSTSVACLGRGGY